MPKGCRRRVHAAAVDLSAEDRIERPREPSTCGRRAHLRFGAQKPPKGRLPQPFSIDVGLPFCGGRLEKEGAGSADAGRRGPAYINGESGWARSPTWGIYQEIGEFAPNRRYARPEIPDFKALTAMGCALYSNPPIKTVYGRVLALGS
jgi:hypothetical protein